MDGENLLFAREDGVEKAWGVVDQVVYHHHKAYPYKPHTWGPKEAEGLVARPRRLAQPGSLVPPPRPGADVPLTLAVDLGGTNMRVAVVDERRDDRRP